MVAVEQRDGPVAAFGQGLGEPAGDGGLALAFLVSGIASFVLLSRQRDAMSGALMARLKNRGPRTGGFRARLEEGARAEDEEGARAEDED